MKIKRKSTGLIRSSFCFLLLGSVLGYSYGDQITERQKEKIIIEELKLVTDIGSINAPQFKAPLPKPKEGKTF